MNVMQTLVVGYYLYCRVQQVRTVCTAGQWVWSTWSTWCYLPRLTRGLATGNRGPCGEPDGGDDGDWVVLGGA